MIIGILTLFPDMFRGPIDESILKRAQEKNLLKIILVNIRDFAGDKYRTTDDYPYGGGPGMVMKPEPIFEALDFLRPQIPKGPVILLSPQGELWNQDLAKDLAKNEGLILICGRYEGVDERVRSVVDEEVSIGDYVLTGGELAAMVIIDVIARMLPGVVGDCESVKKDSFYEGLLDYPHYTRPVEYRGMRVPEILMSGNHEAIRRWRLKESLRRTRQRRPDLLTGANLTPEDILLLKEIEVEEGK